MIDNLDEAIKHCIKIAEAEENKYSYFMESAKSDAMREEEAKCKECANEHRQLAKWLKELKDYKDARVGCEYCKHNYREQHERPCSLCQRNFMDMFEREVNADEESE